VFTPPAFQRAIYDGASVLAIWQPAANPGIAVMGYLVTVSGSDGTSVPATFLGAGTTVGRVPTGALRSNVTYTIAICAQASGQPNACATPVTLLVLQPVLTSVDCTAASVRMTWTPLPVTVQGLVSYTMSLFPTGGGATTSVTIESPTASSGTIPLPAPLAGAFSVQLFANTNVNVSSATPVTSINTALPSLSAVSYDGVEASVAWMPPSNPTQPITGYTVLVASPAGKPSFSVTVPAAQTIANVPLPVPLDPAAPYIVVLTANTGAVVSTSVASPMLVTLPRLESLDWNGTALTATWDPVPYPDPLTRAYQLMAYGVGGGQAFVQAISDPYAGAGQIPSPSFTSGIAYMFTVAAQTVLPEARSVPVAIFTATPQIAAVEFDGRQVAVTWTAFAPAAPAVHHFLVSVTAAGGPSFTTRVDNPAAVSAIVDVTGIGGAGLTYSVVVAATTASGVTATSAPTALVLPQPALKKATYDIIGVTADWDAPANVAVTGYLLRLFGADGTIIESLPIAPNVTSGEVGTGTPLPGSTEWYLTVVATTSGSRVLSTPVLLLIDRPVILSAAFDTASQSVALRWTPSLTGRPAADGYVLEGLSPPNPPTSIAHVWNPASTEGTLTVNAPYARVCAARGIVRAASSPELLMKDAVAMSGVRYDGQNAIASWGSIQTAKAYSVAIVSSGGTLAQAIVTDTTAVLPVACDSTRSYVVEVCPLGKVAVGPPAQSPIIAVTPGITTIATTLQQGNTSGQVIVTLDTSSTSGAAGVTGYQASLYTGSRRVAGPVAAVTAGGVTTVTIPFNCVPSVHYQIRAQAVGADASNQTGPLTAASAVIGAPPLVDHASYDGQLVHASWSAVDQPGVTGYAATLTDTTTTVTVASVSTTDRSTTLAAPLALTDSYALAVRATGDVAVGPPSATANPLAQSLGYFFPASTASQYAYVFRGDIRAPGPSDLVVYLPMLFSAPPTTISVAPFVLQLASSPVNASLPYTLTVAQNASINVWAFSANGIRAALRTAYLAFLQQVEAPANGLLPGAMAVLQQAIAQALPLTFAETLYYACGFDAVAGYVNLQPGMRLRVDFESRQLVSPDPQGLLSGFVGVGTSYYTIDRLANGVTVPALFDPFLGSMTLPVVAANTGGGAGVIDLQGSRFQQPYVRLFYPPTFPSSDGGGASGVSQNVVIVGAPSIAKLEEATAAYLRNRDFSGVTGIFWTYFRGRATFIPEVACFVRGAATYVSLGSTVRNLAERFSPLPFRQAATIAGFAYRRSIDRIVDAPLQVATIYPYARDNAVNFAYRPASSYQYSGGLDCFDLPVLPGDSLDVGA
jgi:hypothetical protein